MMNWEERVAMVLAERMTKVGITALSINVTKATVTQDGSRYQLAVLIDGAQLLVGAEKWNAEEESC